MTPVFVFGFVAYFFIVLFSPIQLWGMWRGKNIDLGVRPLASLILGLVLLQGTFFYVTVPLYVFVGTATSLTFTAAIAACVVYSRWAQRLNNPPSAAEWTYTLPKPEAEMPMSAQDTCGPMPSGPAPVSKQDFDSCRTCGCLVWAYSNPVETRVQDVALFHALGASQRAHQAMLEAVRPVRVDSYCTAHRLPYDEVVIYPGLEVDDITHVEYFTRVDVPASMRAAEHVNRHQVNEDGTNYD